MHAKTRLLFSGLVTLFLLGCGASSLLADAGIPELYREFDGPAATLALQRTRAAGGQVPVAGEDTTAPLTFTATPAPEALLLTNVPCAYSWDTQPLQEETARVRVAFEESGLGRAEVWATAYGERCVNLDTNSTVGGFRIIQTDYHVRMGVQDLADEEALGKLLGQIVQTLAGFPEGTFPGSQTGSVSVEFLQEDQGEDLWFPLSGAMEAYRSGLRDAAFLQALRNL